MPKQKHFYYVGVDTPTGTRLVTKLNYSTKYAKWEKGKKPLAMTKTVAEDIVFGLCMNFTLAFVVMTLFELSDQLGAFEEVDAK